MEAASEVKVFRNHIKYDPVKFSDKLKGVDWDCEQDPSGTNEEQNACVDELWTDFENKILEVVDRHVPFILTNVCGLGNCPWMTGDIKTDIR